MGAREERNGERERENKGEQGLMTIYQSRRSIRRVIKIGASRDRIDSMQIASSRPSRILSAVVNIRSLYDSLSLLRAWPENRVLWAASLDQV